MATYSSDWWDPASWGAHAPEQYNNQTADSVSQRTFGGPNTAYNQTAAQSNGADVTNYNQDRGTQQNLYGQLGQVANGQGPSAAVNAAQAQRNSGAQQAQSIIAGGRGRTTGANARMALNSINQNNSSAASNQSIGQANEMATARGQMVGVAGQMANQDISVAQMGQQNNQFNTGQTNQISQGNQSTQANIGNAELQARSHQGDMQYSNLDPGSTGFMGDRISSLAHGAVVMPKGSQDLPHYGIGGIIGGIVGGPFGAILGKVIDGGGDKSKDKTPTIGPKPIDAGVAPSEDGRTYGIDPNGESVNSLDYNGPSEPPPAYANGGVLGIGTRRMPVSLGNNRGLATAQGVAGLLGWLMQRHDQSNKDDIAAQDKEDAKEKWAQYLGAMTQNKGTPAAPDSPQDPTITSPDQVGGSPNLGAMYPHPDSPTDNSPTAGWQGALPGYAKGGVISGPQKALVGEAGPEAVVNLDQIVNKPTVTTLGQHPQAVIPLSPEKAPQRKHVVDLALKMKAAMGKR